MTASDNLSFEKNAGIPKIYIKCGGYVRFIQNDNISLVWLKKTANFNVKNPLECASIHQQYSTSKTEILKCLYQSHDDELQMQYIFICRNFKEYHTIE